MPFTRITCFFDNYDPDVSEFKSFPLWNMSTRFTRGNTVSKNYQSKIRTKAAKRRENRSKDWLKKAKNMTEKALVNELYLNNEKSKKKNDNKNKAESVATRSMHSESESKNELTFNVTASI